jgi:hypothetical protein
MDFDEYGNMVQKELFDINTIFTVGWFGYCVN